MSANRKDEVGIKLTNAARTIYDELPAKGKGQWISDAMIKKHEREQGVDLHSKVQEQGEHIDQLKRRIEEIERKVQG